MSVVIESIHDTFISIARLRAMPLIMKRWRERCSSNGCWWMEIGGKIVNVPEHKWENGQRGRGVIKFQLHTFFCAPSIEIEKVSFSSRCWCVRSEKYHLRNESVKPDQTRTFIRAKVNFSKARMWINSIYFLFGSIFQAFKCGRWKKFVN